MSWQAAVQRAAATAAVYVGRGCSSGSCHRQVVLPALFLLSCIRGGSGELASRLVQDAEWQEETYRALHVGISGRWAGWARLRCRASHICTPAGCRVYGYGCRQDGALERAAVLG